MLTMQVITFPITVEAEAEFVILSGEDLISGESSGMKDEYVTYDYEQKKIYTRFEPVAGTTDARPVITQESTGINFGKYEYYVISYFSLQTTKNAMPMAFVVDQSSLQAVLYRTKQTHTSISSPQQPTPTETFLFTRSVRAWNFSKKTDLLKTSRLRVSWQSPTQTSTSVRQSLCPPKTQATSTVTAILQPPMRLFSAVI